MTFEPTRVKIGSADSHESIDNYINANLVDIKGKTAIATQAPISKFTFYNFWRMIETYKVRKIFMLSACIEKTKLKCDRYIPQNTLPESKIVVKEYEIVLKEEIDLNPKKTVKVRKLELTNTLTK